MAITYDSGSNTITVTGSATFADIQTAFVFQLKPEDTMNLTPGLKFLSIDVKNSEINFRREIVQVNLNLKPSGM